MYLFIKLIINNISSSLSFTSRLILRSFALASRVSVKLNYDKINYYPLTETRTKLRQANLGKTLSVEIQAKISAAQGTVMIMYSF